MLQRVTNTIFRPTPTSIDQSGNQPSEEDDLDLLWYYYMYWVRVIRPSADTRQPRSISPKTRFACAWRSTCWESRSTSDHSNTSDKRHTTQPTHDRAYVFRDELPTNVFIQRIRHRSSKCQKVYDIYIGVNPQPLEVCHHPLTPMPLFTSRYIYARGGGGKKNRGDEPETQWSLRVPRVLHAYRKNSELDGEILRSACRS